MRVFISWSGKLAKDVGNLLGDWLPEVIQATEPWIAPKDIAAGDPFRERLRETLSSIDFGILCLTKESAKAPWVLFEAGALSKAAETSVVCPYLIDVKPSDLPAPIQDLQAVSATEDGTYQLVERINKALKDRQQPGALKDDKLLKRVFELTWPRFHLQLAVLRNTEGPPVEWSEFFMINKKSGKCLQPAGAGNGNVVQAVSYQGAPRQRWTLHKTAGDYYVVLSVRSAKCLDVKNKEKMPDEIVHQWDFLGERHQKWKMEDGESGSVRFQNVNSGHYLGVRNTTLRQLNYENSGNQCWWLQPTWTD